MDGRKKKAKDEIYPFVFELTIWGGGDCTPIASHEQTVVKNEQKKDTSWSETIVAGEEQAGWFCGIGHRPGVSHFPWWNHWPVTQLPSDGRYCQAPDRAAHFSLAWVSPLEHQGEDQTFWWAWMYGMTDQSAEPLNEVQRSLRAKASTPEGAAPPKLSAQPHFHHFPPAATVRQGFSTVPEGKSQELIGGTVPHAMIRRRLDHSTADRAAPRAARI